MQEEYKQCPNGHYYQGDHCPYCKTGTAETSGPTLGPTDDVDVDYPPTGESSVNNGGFSGAGTPGAGGYHVGGTGTMIDDEEWDQPGNTNGQPPARSRYRQTRKLVGWLVSYSLDPMGVDFKIYEGRNIIGRDLDCSITVNDPTVSAKHAVLLFRSGKYSIKDNQSTHGTFVNDVDIDLDSYYLTDGDVIKMGKTVFKFRSSI